MQEYTALMIDIKNSRAYSTPHREEIQAYITLACSALNGEFCQVLERAVEFSAGDELQGLFRTPKSAYCYLRLLRMLLWPVQVRAGIGVGRWEVRMLDAGSTAQDGQAYHRCRSAIEEAGEKGQSDFLFVSDGVRDEEINFAIGMESLLTGRYSPHQNDLLLLTELLFPVMVLNTEPLAQVMREQSRFELYASRKKAFLFLNLKKTPSMIKPMEFDLSGKSWGIPTAVASYSGILRQSVEKTMKAANMFAARKAAMMALKLMPDREEIP